MIGPLTLLIVLQVISALGRPVPHALVTCDQVLVCGAEDGSCEEGTLVGDSAGKVIIEGDAGTYVCTGRRPDGSHTVTVALVIDAKHTRPVITLQP